MAERTALLIRCSVEEAARIRERAAEEHRTVAGYMLHILERMIAVDETLDEKPTLAAVIQYPADHGENDDRCLSGRD